MAKRAKPKPPTQPEASEPAQVTKARSKPAAGSVAPKKMSALDILRRLEKKRNVSIR